MRDISPATCKKIIRTHHFMPFTQKSVTQMRSEKPCPASYKNAFRRVVVFHLLILSLHSLNLFKGCNEIH
jgi:hypothetical protein